MGIDEVGDAEEGDREIRALAVVPRRTEWPTRPPANC
jgi:hypothetical protein